MQNGFTLQGNVTDAQQPFNSSGQYYDWWDGFQVQRSLYIGDTLYTYSPNVVEASYLGNLSEISNVTIYNQTIHPMVFNGEVGAPVPGAS